MTNHVLQSDSMPVNTFSCIIVDDDPLASQVLQSLVDKTASLHLEQVCSTPIEASHLLHQKQVNIIFLDIEMPEMSGLEFIDTLKTPPQIILTSGKKDYVEDAFDKEVADYLIKPLSSYPRFLKAVNKATKRIQTRNESSSDRSHLFIKVDSLLQSLTLSDILWIQAYGDFIKVRTVETTHTVLGRLKDMLEKLPDKDFVQIHRSYIVRIDKVKNIDQSNLQIAKQILPISKSLKKNLLERIMTM